MWKTFCKSRGLDRKMGREMIKVALLYVEHGQSTEQAILGNQHKSAEYADFRAALNGPSVRVRPVHR